MGKIKEKIDKKVEEVKQSVKRKVDWVVENPDKFVILSTALISIAGVTTRGTVTVVKQIHAANEERDEKCRVWDPVNGIQWYTKKPMTTNQRLEFERRVANGENRGEVLSSMRVLRR